MMYVGKVHAQLAILNRTGLCELLVVHVFRLGEKTLVTCMLHVGGFEPRTDAQDVN
jgi:hypothetical protein